MVNVLICLVSDWLLFKGLDPYKELTGRTTASIHIHPQL